MIYFWNAILVLAIVFLIRVLLTKQDLITCKKLQKDFQSNQNPSPYIYKQLVKKTRIPLPHFAGYLNGSIIPSENIDDLFPKQELSTVFEERMTLMIDIFNQRYKENFSPFFWIQTIIILPSKILAYLGVREDALASKILNVLFWATSLLGILIKAWLIKFFQIK